MSATKSMSKRGWSNVEAIMPRIEKAVAEREKQHNENSTSARGNLAPTPDGKAAPTEFPSLIDLSTAEDWSLRDEILLISKDAITISYKAHHFSYPGGFAGDPELLETLAGFFNARFAPLQPVISEHVVVAPGAAGCLDALLYNICDPGDGVLIPAPYWSAFDFILKARNSIEIIPVHVDQIELVLTDALLDSLESVVKSSDVRLKALLMCNPHNPLSQCYPRSVLEKCLQFCQTHDLHYISDEIYALTNFPCEDLPTPEPLCSALSMDLQKLGVDKSRVHVVWSSSKDFGQNGVRMGALVTQNNIEIRTGVALAANTTVSSYTAVATTAILQHPLLDELLSLRSKRLYESYTAITALFNKHRLEYIPANAGLYVFVRLTPSRSSWEDEATAIDRLKKGGISVAPGKSYHMPDSCKGWARISFSLRPDLLDEAIRRMDEVLSAHTANLTPSS